MTDDRNASFADRLIEVDHSERSTAPPTPDPAFELLLEHERQVAARVQRIAMTAWTAAFTCLLLFAIAFFIVRNVGDGVLIEVTRAGLVVVTVTGVLALAAAVTTSLVWLFRSRTPTLRAIDRRLATLERLLMERSS